VCTPKNKGNMPHKCKVKWEEELYNMMSMGKSGRSMSDIARHYGVSRQRIKQIVKKNFPNWQDQCGRFVRDQEKEIRYRAKWGLQEDTDLYRMKRQKWRGKQANAKRAGKPWSLPFGELVWPTHCPILGIELDYFSEGRQENSVSFDCINPELGYVIGNVQVISWRANRIKNDGTAEEHRKISDYLDNLKTPSA
jgi:hypothetical protein